ncbi:MAG: hypothetical protein DRN14_03880 [Thermoplasmata archaeon]|nr:MAG: hypothetical protein DRN14_03880 [Thermoplasmata archaeon]
MARKRKITEEIPSTTPEPINEETPKVIPEPIKEEKTPVKLAEKEIPTSVITFETIIEEAMLNPALAPIADVLKSYVDVCYKQASSDEITIANMNYNLFNIILGSLNVKDRKVSNLQMTFINKVFLIEKDRYFNTISLSRYDHFWSFGIDSKMGYSMLIKYISAMANPNTRKQQAKTHIAEKMNRYLPEGIVGKLELFYKV